METVFDSMYLGVVAMIGRRAWARSEVREGERRKEKERKARNRVLL
jgi:hypothetical protein